MSFIVRLYRFLLARPLPVLIGILIALLYRPIMKYPFLSDDWIALHQFSVFDLEGCRRIIFRYTNPFSYRPLGYLYTYIFYNLFGPNAFIFRITLLTIHFFNSLLLFAVLRRITKDRFIAGLAAVLYAASTAIHLYPLSWPSTGFFDLGGMFFFSASFLLFLRKRLVASSLLFGAALFTKPTTCTLPLILLAYMFFAEEGEGFSFKDALLRLRLHWLMLLPLAVCTLLNYSVLHKTARFSTSPPYLFENILYFFGVPLPLLFPSNPVFVLNALFVICVAAFWRSRTPAHPPLPKAQAVFFVAWFIIGLLPVLTMRYSINLNYYLTYSWPAFIVLFLLFARQALWRFFYAAFRLRFFMIMLVCFSVFSSGVYLYESDRLKFNSKEKMVRGAHFLMVAHSKLRRVWPVMPENVILVFEGTGNIDVYWYFAERNHAVRMWYNNETLEVCKLEDMEFGKDSFTFGCSEYKQNFTRAARESAFYLFRWNKGEPILETATFEELRRLKEAYLKNSLEQ